MLIPTSIASRSINSCGVSCHVEGFESTAAAMRPRLCRQGRRVKDRRREAPTLGTCKGQKWECIKDKQVRRRGKDRWGMTREVAVAAGRERLSTRVRDAASDDPNKTSQRRGRLSIREQRDGEHATQRDGEHATPSRSRLARTIPCHQPPSRQTASKARRVSFHDGKQTPSPPCTPTLRLDFLHVCVGVRASV